MATFADAHLVTLHSDACSLFFCFFFFSFFSFFFNDPAPTEIYTLSLHDALPISYGEITDFSMITDRETGNPKGFAFITFATQVAAEKIGSAHV